MSSRSLLSFLSLLSPVRPRRRLLAVGAALALGLGLAPLTAAPAEAAPPARGRLSVP
ncbi:hypothetical protein AB0O07_32575 [Streptomyces sp. NPDC093085]|uniref:hypothetical protein n=1 Tax=Streptomyces sp. NPDC093085 TaxID=3155068 RepID=UPI00341F422E